MLAAAYHTVWSQPVADPPKHGVARTLSWGDPSALIDQLLGGSMVQDQQALEAIELSIAEERRLGGRAFAAYQDYLTRQGTRLTSRGTDVQYVLQLVELVRPQLEQAQRYPRVKVFVAAERLARCPLLSRWHGGDLSRPIGIGRQRSSAGGGHRS